MNLSDLIPPERVRDIAKEFYSEHGGCSSKVGAAVIIYAAPEIARAVLLEAARIFENESTAIFDRNYKEGVVDTVRALRQMAEEFK